MQFKNDFQKYSFAFLASFAIACIAFYAVVRLLNIESSVIDGYFPYADAMFSGIVPYTEKVFVYGSLNDWEYPPLTYLFLFIPRLFASTPEGYEAVFIVLIAVFFGIGLWCSNKLSEEYGYNRYSIMLLYSVLMFLMLEFLLDRNDIFPMVLTMLSMYCMVKKKYVLAFVLLSMGTMTKLYPAVLFPVYFLALATEKDWKNTIIGTISFIGTALVIVVPLLLCGSDIMMFVGYHSGRPIEIEAVVASLIEFISMLGLTDISYVYSFGSDNIVGSLPDSISSIMIPLMVFLIFLTYLAYLFVAVRKGNSKETSFSAFIVALFLAVAMFIVAGKVFSGQYMVWMIPFILFFAVAPFSNDDKKKVVYLFIASEIMTQLNFAVNFGMREAGEALSSVGIVVILVRNLLVIATMVLMFMAVKRMIYNSSEKIILDS